MPKCANAAWLPWYAQWPCNLTRRCSQGTPDSHDSLQEIRDRKTRKLPKRPTRRSRRHAIEPFAASPGLALLDNHASLRLVTDVISEDDALALALTCTSLRDALWARFEPRPLQDLTDLDDFCGTRIRTRDAAVVVTAERLAWVAGMPVLEQLAWLRRGMSALVSRNIAKWPNGMAAMIWAHERGGR
jgi:hypothetical protein